MPFPLEKLVTIISLKKESGTVIEGFIRRKTNCLYKNSITHKKISEVVFITTPEIYKNKLI